MVMTGFEPAGIETAFIVITINHTTSSAGNQRILVIFWMFVAAEHRYTYNFKVVACHLRAYQFYYVVYCEFLWTLNEMSHSGLCIRNVRAMIWFQAKSYHATPHIAWKCRTDNMLILGCSVAWCCFCWKSNHCSDIMHVLTLCSDTQTVLCHFIHGPYKYAKPCFNHFNLWTCETLFCEWRCCTQLSLLDLRYVLSVCVGYNFMGFQVKCVQFSALLKWPQWSFKNHLFSLSS